MAFGLLMLAVMGAALAAMFGSALISGGPGVSGETVLGFISLFGLVLLIATMFVPEAIVLDSAGPIRAIRSSLQVVSRNFWQAMGFFLVSLLISPGLLAVWEEIASDLIGLTVAIVVNAGMVTSLALASLGFYKARSGNAAHDA